VTPATGTALIVLVAFVLPGFVVVLFQERTFKQAEELTPFDRLLRTVYYSVWCYLLLAAVALIFGVDRASIEHLYHRDRGDPAQLGW
jgi:chromate transport protein ChrA